MRSFPRGLRPPSTPGLRIVYRGDQTSTGHRGNVPSARAFTQERHADRRIVTHDPHNLQDAGGSAVIVRAAERGTVGVRHGSRPEAWLEGQPAAGTGLGGEGQPAAGTSLGGEGRTGTETGDDATMVARARDGDVHAFEVLVRRYQRPIYRLAFRMLSDTGEAEDVTQDTFVTAWRRLPEIRADAAFRGWLYRTAANRCLNILRARRPTAPLQEAAMPSASPAASPEASAEAHERLAALRIALDGLTVEQRACWLPREMEGLSYAEIAAILHTSPQAVRGRLARARAELGEAMTSWR